MNKSNEARRARVTRNFIKKYGRAKFRKLINALSSGESGQSIANDYNVSRERVRQWKNTFGEIISYYRVYPEVDAFLEDRRSR